MSLFFFAIAAGFLTVLAPCILPILPIILGSGSGGSKWRPVYVVLGFILSFSIFGAVFATAGSFLGLSNEVFRTIAIVLLFIFGFALVFESVYQKFTAGFSAKLSQLGAKISGGGKKHGALIEGLLIGVSLGLIWTPCAGPILGTILTLAVTEGDVITVGILFGAYSFGAAVPMLAIAYSGGWFFEKMKRIGSHVDLLNKIFGMLILLTALAIVFGYDTVIQSYLLRFYPSDLLGL